MKQRKGLNFEGKLNVIQKLHNKVAIAALAIVFALAGTATIYAANNTDLNQTINAGTLATDIRDASRVTVASPAVAMSAATFSFDCLTGASRPSGTFGTNTERIYVDNPSAADDGWNLTIAATGGATDDWENGGDTIQYDFNDPDTGGCGDGGDADSLAGQLSVDPSGGTLTADCGSCTTGNITLGSASAFEQGVTDSITMLSAAAASDDIGRWYFTGVDMDQTIPAEQADDSYTLNLTLTVTAI